MPLSQEYQYLYKYYCKKYGEQRALNILVEKPEKFLSRANDICMWKDSFDKGAFFELKKIDDSSVHYKHRPKTKFAEKSQAKKGSGCASVVFRVTIVSLICAIAFYTICFLFKINYNLKFLAYVAPILIGLTLLIGALREIYNFRARFCLNKRQKEFPYASLYIQHCAQNVEVKEIVNIPKLDLELINIYYEAISDALQKQITINKEQLYNKLNEFCQSADYHNVVCKSIVRYSYRGKRLPNIKKLMPFSEIREHFDDPKGFRVLMALLNTNNDSNKISPNYNYDNRYFDSAYFNTNSSKGDKTYGEFFILLSILITIILSFFCFKFPFVWYQQKPIAEEKFLHDSLDKYNQACTLIDMDYKKKLLQPAYIVGISVEHELVSNGGIGNDWYIYDEVNGEKINSSEIKDTVLVGDILDLYSEITEEDPSSDDVGCKFESVPITLEQLENGTPATLNVNVRETHGRGAGKSANWQSNFYIRKIKKLKHLPKNYKPQKEPYPPKPNEKTKQKVSSWEVFKLTMKNLI